MSKVALLRFSDGHMAVRKIVGAATYWGGGSNVDSGDMVNSSGYPGAAGKGRYFASVAELMGSATDGNQGTPGGMSDTYFGGELVFFDQYSSATVSHVRHFHSWDLSEALPANAIVRSAILTFSIQGEVGLVAPADLAAFYPIPISIYQVLPNIKLAAAADGGATMLDYDSGASAAWGVYGTADAVDFKTPAVASMNFTAAMYASQTNRFTFDITSLAQRAVQTNTRKLVYLVSRSVAHEQSFPSASHPSGGSTAFTFLGIYFAFPGSLEPTLTVTYDDPLVVHTSNSDGTIDPSIFVDTTAANVYQFDSISVGGIGSAVKFWVQNLLNTSVANLRLFSQQSHAGKAFELIRTGVGDGTIYAGGADPGTTDQSTGLSAFTVDERWQIRMTSPTAFQVWHDNNTNDDPTQTPAYIQDTPGTGTVGSAYTSTLQNITFTVTAGGTAFINGDVLEFKTYGQDFTPAAPGDSDEFLQMAPDVGNSPGSFQPIMIKATKATANVSGSTVVPVLDTDLFGIGQTVVITARTLGNQQFGVVNSINPGVSITLNVSITCSQYDYVEGKPLGQTTLAPQGTWPFWLRPKSPSSTTRQFKYPRLRAMAD